MIFIALPCGKEDSPVLSLEFDTRKNLFRELEEKRVKHQAKEPVSLVKVDTGFFYAGKDGKVFMLDC